MKEKAGKVRVYLIDRPSFLSCDRTYVTNLENRIILWDKGYGSISRCLVFGGKGNDTPYNLAPYPVRARPNWEAPIEEGKRVYPVCAVDMPSGYTAPKEKDVPRIIRVLEFSDVQFRDCLRQFRQYAEKSSAIVGKELRKVDEKYQRRLKGLKDEIRTKKERIREKHLTPYLADVISASLITY